MSAQVPKDTNDAAARFAAVAAAFARNTAVTKKRMFSSDNVLAVDGRIFAMLARGKFVAKLPKTRVDELTAAGAGKNFDPGHGRLMNEWIALDSTDVDWIALAKEAYHFVRAAEGS